MPGILKLSEQEQDELKELAHELDFMGSLTTAQRFELMFRKSHELARELLKHGHRKPFKIAKRS